MIAATKEEYESAHQKGRVPVCLETIPHLVVQEAIRRADQAEITEKPVQASDLSFLK